MKKIGTRMAVLLSLIVTIGVLPFTQIPPLRTFEARYADLLLTFLAKKAQPSQDIVIVKVTEDTLANLPYRSPIDRGLLWQCRKCRSAADGRLCAPSAGRHGCCYVGLYRAT
jgi:CHASE2 domain-containing sensor protein